MKFNNAMKHIAKCLYLQTRYCRAQLLIDGIRQTKPLLFGIRFIDGKEWAVSDLCFDKNDDVIDSFYTNISHRLNVDGDHGVFMLLDHKQQFRGVLYGIEGAICQYTSSHDNTLLSYNTYTLDDCDEEQIGNYEIKEGDPLFVPKNWNKYISINKEQ